MVAKTPDAWAEALRTAQQTGQVIPALRDNGLDSIEQAYQIQSINVAHKIDSGLRIIGHKIGLTSPAVQKQLGVSEPDFGVLTQEMEVLMGGSIDVAQLIQPKAEVEIAFVLGEDMHQPDMSIVDVMACVDFALPAIEVVDSRIENWNIGILDTVADNASSSHFVLGHTPKTLDEIDIIQCKMTLHKNGLLVSEGEGAACLGSPLNALHWLAHEMLAYGAPLKAGQVILTGALGPMTTAEKGDELVAQIEGLGPVHLSFK